MAELGAQGAKDAGSDGGRRQGREDQPVRVARELVVAPMEHEVGRDRPVAADVRVEGPAVQAILDALPQQVAAQHQGRLCGGCHARGQGQRDQDAQHRAPDGRHRPPAHPVLTAARARGGSAVQCAPHQGVLVTASSTGFAKNTGAPWTGVCTQAW